MMQLIGKGNTAEVFEHGEGTVCKLFKVGYPTVAIERECHNARMMAQLGMPVPSCQGIITTQNRRGIIYKRIDGKNLLAYALETGDTVFLEETLVALHRELLKCHTQEVISYKDFLMQLLPNSRMKDRELVEKIQGLPEGDYLCHGDFHPLNIMVNDDKEVFLIDFMNVCHGPWQYDVARTYFLISYDDISSEVPHKAALLQMKIQLANTYLEKMNVFYKEIEGFVELINRCREWE